MVCGVYGVGCMVWGVWCGVYGAGCMGCMGMYMFGGAVCGNLRKTVSKCKSCNSNSTPVHTHTSEIDVREGDTSSSMARQATRNQQKHLNLPT